MTLKVMTCNLCNKQIHDNEVLNLDYSGALSHNQCHIEEEIKRGPVTFEDNLPECYDCGRVCTYCYEQNKPI